MCKGTLQKRNFPQPPPPLLPPVSQSSINKDQQRRPEPEESVAKTFGAYAPQTYDDPKKQPGIQPIQGAKPEVKPKDGGVKPGGTMPDMPNMSSMNHTLEECEDPSASPLPPASSSTPIIALGSKAKTDPLAPKITDDVKGPKKGPDALLAVSALTTKTESIEAEKPKDLKVEKPKVDAKASKSDSKEKDDKDDDDEGGDDGDDGEDREDDNEDDDDDETDSESKSAQIPKEKQIRLRPLNTDAKNTDDYIGRLVMNSKQDNTKTKSEASSSSLRGKGISVSCFTFVLRGGSC